MYAWFHKMPFVFLAFFFYGDAGHRVLHSFPTRRSSDLEECPNETRTVGQWLVVVGPGCRVSGAGTSERDRKSTRLNSSHGYISYAVFCLKKKRGPVVTRSLLTASATASLPHQLLQRAST